MDAVWRRYLEGGQPRSAAHVRVVHFVCARPRTSGEHDAVQPVVLLGDQKESSVNRHPFNENYEAFAIAVELADEIVLARFSFQDRPLTRTVTRHRQKDARITVTNASAVRASSRLLAASTERNTNETMLAPSR